MLPYYLIFGLLALLAFSDAFTVNPRQRQLLFLFAGLVLALFAGMRSDVFPDYEAYALYFDELSSGNESTLVATEPGFILINKVIGFFTGNSVWLFMFMAVTAVAINLKSFKDYTPFFFIPVLVYFSHTYLGRELMQIRAGVAAAMCLFALRYIMRNQFWRFLLIVLVAASVHLASLAFIVAYPVVKMNMGRKTWALILTMCTLIGIVSPLGALLRQLPFVDAISRLQDYTASDTYGGSLGVLTNPTFLKQLFISSIGLVFYDKLSAKVPYFRTFLICYLIATCWLVLWNDFGILAARVATFFSISEGLLLASFMYLVSRESRPIYVTLVIALAFMMLYLNLSDPHFPPYQSVL